jgi:hypothetical protein
MHIPLAFITRCVLRLLNIMNGGLRADDCNGYRTHRIAVRPALSPRSEPVTTPPPKPTVAPFVTPHNIRTLMVYVTRVQCG